MEQVKLQFQGQLYRCRADMLRDIAREWVSGGGVTVEELTPYMSDAIHAAACE